MLTTKLTNIADSIRSKINSNEKMTLDEMPTLIENISTAEDLSEELNKYDEELTTQETSIQDIMLALEGKAIGSGGSAGNEPNVFVQENEPSIKEGIWLQTNQPFNKITFTELGNAWTYDTDKAIIPYEFKEGRGVQIGEEVYLFGGGGGENTAYKYNIETNTYTQLANIPITFRYEPCTAVGTDIYLSCGVGAFSDSNKLYKYDTVNNTYTQLANRPTPNTGSSLIAVDDNTIYSFGCDWGSSYGQRAYKYDITSDTWTQIASPPIPLSYSNLCVIDTKVYIFGSWYDNYNYAIYIYDTVTDTYEALANSPCRVMSVVTKNENNFYIVGWEAGNTDDPRMYMFNTKTKTFGTLSSLPYAIDIGAVLGMYEEELIIMGGGTQPTTTLTLKSNLSDFVNHSVIIDWNTKTTDTYSFKLFDTSKITNDFSDKYIYYFHDVFYCTTDNQLDYTIPTYYGNGTVWIKFKN